MKKLIILSLITMFSLHSFAVDSQGENAKRKPHLMADNLKALFPKSDYKKISDCIDRNEEKASSLLRKQQNYSCTNPKWQRLDERRFEIYANNELQRKKLAALAQELLEENREFLEERFDLTHWIQRFDLTHWIP